MAMTIVQSGQSLVYFANAVADYSVRSSVDLEDIPDFEIEASLCKVYVIFCFRV